MKSSPLIQRHCSLRTAADSENTPKRKKKDIGDQSKSPLSRSWVSWSSKKKSGNRIDKKHELASTENIHKDLLEFQTKSNYAAPEIQGVARNIRFTEPDEPNRKSAILKCRNHDEGYSFYSVNDKRFLCNKCLYNKIEKVTSGAFKNSVVPLEKCSDFISYENSHFIDVECQQYLRQLQRNISACNHNNNFLMQKQEVFQGIVST